MVTPFLERTVKPVTPNKFGRDNVPAITSTKDA